MLSEEPLPDDWLLGVAPALKARGAARALDVACGRGANAAWFERRGFQVLGVDVSTEALTYAARLSEATGARVAFALRDLEREGLPEGPWDAIVVFHYLQRDLFGALAEHLAPGGLLIYKTHLAHGLRGEAPPHRKDFLLEPGELLHAFRVLRVLEYREWATTGNAYAALLACKG